MTRSIVCWHFEAYDAIYRQVPQGLDSAWSIAKWATEYHIENQTQWVVNLLLRSGEPR